jgi:hypothetical protein
MCTQLLKETVAYYTTNNSSVFCVMLDASKAFDRVSFAKLFLKMLNRNISPIVIRMLISLYCNQSYGIKWNNSMSATFPVCNGVRQGAVFSPVLFCIYLDELLHRLKKASVGCFVGSYYLGALCYADDLTLLAPTANAMRVMLNVCEEYANEHAILFNAEKTKCLVFEPRSAPPPVRPTFFISGKAIEYTSSWPHLGNIIDDSEDDYKCIAAMRFKLIGQVNNVLSTFGKLDSVTKNALLHTFCSSLYGSVTWNMSHTEIDRVCSTWRIALRRVWGLPPNAHCDIVSALGSQRVLLDDICSRFLKFVFFCLSNRNNNRTVNFIVRNSLFICRALSPLGRNFKYIVNRYNFRADLIFHENRSSVIMSYISNFCREKFQKVCTPSFMCLMETILLRDKLLSFDPNYESLNTTDLQSIITQICTQ